MSEETAMTTTNTAAMAASPDINYDEDTMLPRLRIVQPTSRDGLAGTFRSALTGEEWEVLHAMPILYRKGRVMWEEGNDTPVCRSNDSVYPAATVEDPPSTMCSQVVGGRSKPVCRHSEWGDDGTPPPCKLTYQLIATTEEAGPVMLSLHGSQIKPVKGLITYSRYSCAHPAGADWPPFALCNLRCTMMLDQAKTTKGKYYRIRFAELARLSEDEVREALAMLGNYAQYDIGSHFAAEAEADAGAKDEVPF